MAPESLNKMNPSQLLFPESNSFIATVKSLAVIHSVTAI